MSSSSANNLVEILEDEEQDGGDWSLLPPSKMASSWAWKYFNLYDVDVHIDKAGFAHCSKCNDSVKYGGSTSKLTNHFFYKHREIYDQMNSSGLKAWQVLCMVT